MTVHRTISVTQARRFVITRQHLAGPQAGRTGSSDIMNVMRDLRYLQIDPMRVVEQSHLLVLWSRLGNFDHSHLDTLLWKEKELFQDWAQTSSIVLTEDYPIFNALKHTFAMGSERYASRIRTWMDKNKKLRDYILAELRSKGPLYSDDFEDKAVEDWESTGWTKGRNVSLMLSFLWAKGKIMIAGRKGIKKRWDLTERYLPDWASREKLTDAEVFRLVAKKSLRALGLATAKQIRQHYVRGCCGDVEKVLTKLEADGEVVRVEVREGMNTLRDPLFICAEDDQLLDQLTDEAWIPRMTLLSPFDNVIVDRRRTEQLFGYSYRFEVYCPKGKRKYGCYVMPILHGERFIGRIDLVMDRKLRHLRVNAVYAEPDAPKTKEVGKEVGGAIEKLGVFLGAEKIVYGRKIPLGWESLKLSA